MIQKNTYNQPIVEVSIMTYFPFNNPHNVFSYIIENDYNNSIVELMNSNYENISGLLKEKYNVSNAVKMGVFIILEDLWNDATIFGFIHNNGSAFEVSEEEANDKYMEFHSYNTREYSVLSDEEREELMRFGDEEDSSSTIERDTMVSPFDFEDSAVCETNENSITSSLCFEDIVESSSMFQSQRTQ